MRSLLAKFIPAMLLLVLAGTGSAELDTVEQAKVNALAAALHLSVEQKAAVLAERETSKQTLLQLERQWQQLHDQLRRAVRSNTPDQTAIDALAESIGKVRGDIIALRTRSLIHLKSLLTPEQLQLLENSGGPDRKTE